MAKPELGIKRQCLNCAAKFYDLNRDPIVCPKCGTVFQAAALAARPEVARSADPEVEGDVVAAAEFVPLEEADADAAAKVATDDVDIDADDIDADDSFLEPEEDEDDSDVSDLIDGDIEDDEES